MNPLDMAIVTILSYSLIRGIFRGLVKEISSIIGVLAGFYAAYTYYPALAGLLDRWITSAAYGNLTSFMIIFCLVFILISIVGIIIKYLLNIAFLGWADRICGAGFGMIKGVLVAAVILISLTTFLPAGALLIRNSITAPHITPVSEGMVKVVSKDMRHIYEAKVKDFKKAWKIP